METAIMKEDDRAKGDERHRCQYSLFFIHGLDRHRVDLCAGGLRKRVCASFVVFQKLAVINRHEVVNRAYEL